MLLIPRSLDRNQFWTCGFSIQMGMKSEAFQLTQAVVQQIYENGLQFRTQKPLPQLAHSCQSLPSRYGNLGLRRSERLSASGLTLSKCFYLSVT